MLPLTTSQPHRFSVEEYMASGVPGSTELVDGVIYEVSPRKPPHILAVRVLARYLNRELDPELYAVPIQSHRCRRLEGPTRPRSRCRRRS